jgi:hypothetical protein
MGEASRAVLDGLEIRTDVDIVAWPNRFTDERGTDFWAKITVILGELLPAKAG